MKSVTFAIIYSIVLVILFSVMIYLMSIVNPDVIVKQKDTAAIMETTSNDETLRRNDNKDLLNSTVHNESIIDINLIDTTKEVSNIHKSIPINTHNGRKNGVNSKDAEVCKHNFNNVTNITAADNNGSGNNDRATLSKNIVKSFSRRSVKAVSNDESNKDDTSVILKVIDENDESIIEIKLYPQCNRRRLKKNEYIRSKSQMKPLKISVSPNDNHGLKWNLMHDSVIKILHNNTIIVNGIEDSYLPLSALETTDSTSNQEIGVESKEDYEKSITSPQTDLTISTYSGFVGVNKTIFKLLHDESTILPVEFVNKLQILNDNITEYPNFNENKITDLNQLPNNESNKLMTLTTNNNSYTTLAVIVNNNNNNNTIINDILDNDTIHAIATISNLSIDKQHVYEKVVHGDHEVGKISFQTDSVTYPYTIFARVNDTKLNMYKLNISTVPPIKFENELKILDKNITNSTALINSTIYDLVRLPTEKFT